MSVLREQAEQLEGKVVAPDNLQMESVAVTASKVGGSQDQIPPTRLHSIPLLGRTSLAHHPRRAR